MITLVLKSCFQGSSQAFFIDPRGCVFPLHGTKSQDLILTQMDIAVIGLKNKQSKFYGASMILSTDD
jgi:hypothetical protein